MTNKNAKKKKKISTGRIVQVSFFVDLLDIVTNLVVSLMTGSAVIFAELIQGVADSIGSVLLVIGHKQSKRPIEPKHPFGHSREVFFWALLSSMVMLFLGSGLSIWRGYNQLIRPEPIMHRHLVLTILLVSVTTNGYALSQSIRRLKRSNISLINSFKKSSQQLVKTALLRDTLGTLSAVIGLISIFLFELLGLVVFDAIGAIVIGLLMAGFAIILISQTKNLIVGQTVPKETLKKIMRAAKKIPEVVAINKAAAIYTGSEQILVDLDIDLKEKLVTTHIEEVLDKIQHSISKAVPEVKTVRIDLNSPLIMKTGNQKS